MSQTLPARGTPSRASAAARRVSRGSPRRGLCVTAAVALAFMTVGGQLVRLAAEGRPGVTLGVNEAIAKSFARPDLLDRNGRLLATDVAAPSLFADPALILGRDEAVEKLVQILPDLDEAELRRALADRSRRFVWVRRGLAPRTAQRIHDLGLPGLAFRRELRRAYPAGSLAGHMLGSVDVDNKGLAGFERYLDEAVGVEPVYGATPTDRPPVRLSLDLGVQHALEDELADATRRYRARGAAGLVLDVASGEVLAAASLPAVDPARPAEVLDPARRDKLASGTYELGSIYKALTVAMALDAGLARLDTLIDVRVPLTAGRFVIKDLHPAPRPLSVADVFLHSSNVGAALLALQAGSERQREFLAAMGLTAPMRTELGPVAPPLLPERWERAQTITISYGHGLAVAPIQFAAAAAALVNGGHLVAPTFRRRDGGTGPGRRVISAETSARVRELMRRNVTDRTGTGRRADVPGLRVGGKTGTAELPGRGGYQRSAVIASFLGAFPMEAPRYLTLVMLFEPKPTPETRGQVTAGVNAAPATGRLIARIAPLLGVEAVFSTSAETALFDAAGAAKY
jgi:cell division protein FtsI (penicillin-binding protein 3)